MDHIKENIRKFIVNEIMYQKNAQILNFDDSLFEKGVLDSGAILDLIMYLESEYSVEVEKTEIIPAHFESIESLTNFILKLKAKN